MHVQPTFVSVRLVLLLLVLIAALTVTQNGVAQAVVFVEMTSIHRGVLGEPGQMHAALANLDALPVSDDPTVVYVQSIDSRYTINNEIYTSDTLMYQERVEVIAAAAADFDGPLPIFVATQWGTPENREADARMMGRPEVPVFPTTSEELAATGYDFLIEPDGITLRWDLEGVIPQFAASRQNAGGVEFISPVEIVLCANSERILGWARGRRDFEPTSISLGRFTRSCINDEFDQPETLIMPLDILEAYGLQGKYFSVLMPYAYAEPVPVDKVATHALAVLALANTEVPLLVVASDTITPNGSEYVTREEHAAALAAKGVETNEAANNAIPDWVQGFVRHTASVLVLFDDMGSPVSAYAASPNNVTNQATLIQGLLRFGLF